MIAQPDTALARHALHPRPISGRGGAACARASCCCTTPASRPPPRPSTGCRARKQGLLPLCHRRSRAITQMVAEEMRAWHAGRGHRGRARPTSIRPPSASRSTTLAMSWDIRTSPRRRSSAVVALARHHRPPRHPRRTGVGALGRGARAQEGPGREVSLGAPGRCRHRPLGGARARACGGAGHGLSVRQARWSPTCRRCCPATATASRPRASSIAQDGVRRALRSSATSGPPRVDGRIDQSTITTLERLLRGARRRARA